MDWCHKEQNSISPVSLGNLSSLEIYTVFMFFVYMDSFSKVLIAMNFNLFWTNNQCFSDFSDALYQTVVSSVHIPPERCAQQFFSYVQEALRLKPSRLPPIQILLSVVVGKKQKSTPRPWVVLCYRQYMEGLYILPLKGAVQSTSTTVSNLDASGLLPQRVDFALLQEAKGQLTKSPRKILSTLFCPQVHWPLWAKNRHAQVSGNWDLRR